MQVSGYTCSQVAARHRALADPTRVRIVTLLLELGELCGCDVEHALGITQSKASRHLGILKQAGLVEDRREGTWVYYRTPPTPDPFAAALLDASRTAVGDDPTMAEEIERGRSGRRSPCAQPPVHRVATPTRSSSEGREE